MSVDMKNHYFANHEYKTFLSCLENMAINKSLDMIQTKKKGRKNADVVWHSLRLINKKM